jgi:dGTP triphosphohydrolase
MVKLSVSKAAKMLGINRHAIQAQINSGKLQTHEGYVTVDSLRLAYPSLNFDSEQDKRLKKMQQIKENAIFKATSVDATHVKNERILMSMVATLKVELRNEKVQNLKTQVEFAKLTYRYEYLCRHLEETLA